MAASTGDLEAEGQEDWINDPDLSCEPVGEGPLATGSVRKSAAFWREFARSSWVLSWIERGYELQWLDRAPAPRMQKNSSSALEHAAFVTSAVAEMLTAGAIAVLPQGERPEVASPLGVAPKGSEGKFRLVINMKYVNEHLAKKKFKFEGLKDLADLAEKGDHAVSFDLTSGYYHVDLHPRTRTFTGFEWKGIYYLYKCLPFGLATAPWVFSKVMRELVMY